MKKRSQQVEGFRFEHTIRIITTADNITTGIREKIDYKRKRVGEIVVGQLLLMFHHHCCYAAYSRILLLSYSFSIKLSTVVQATSYIKCARQTSSLLNC